MFVAPLKTKSFRGEAKCQSDASFVSTTHANCGTDRTSTSNDETIRPVSGLATRCHLQSADMSTLLVPTTRRSTLGDRAFPADAARAWNSLPCHVRDMPSLLAFRRELKTVLFRLSYPVN